MKLFPDAYILRPLHGYKQYVHMQQCRFEVRSVLELNMASGKWRS